MYILVDDTDQQQSGNTIINLHEKNTKQYYIIYP